MSQTECGLCVAVMLMEYYDVRITLNDIPKEFSAGRDGTRIRGLKKIFDHFGFSMNMFKVTDRLSEIKNSSLPGIAYRIGGHFVVVESISSNEVIILDPAFGRTKISKDELDNDYKNLILKITPNENFKTVNTRGQEFSLIKEAVFFNKKLVVQVLIAAVIVYSLTLVAPLLLKGLVDNFLVSKQIDTTIWALSIGTIASSLVYFVVNRVKQITSIRLSISVDKFLSKKVVDKLFKNKFEFYLNRTSSDIQYRLVLLKNLKTIISDIIIQTFLDIGSMVVILIYIMNLQPLYAVFLAFITLLVLSMSRFMREKMLLYKNKELATDSKLQVFQYDIFRAIFDVKVLGLSSKKHRSWHRYYEDYIKSHEKNQRFITLYQNILAYITLYVPIFIPILGIWISGLAHSNQVGTIISLQSITGTYISGLISIAQLSDNITTAKSYLIRIDDILLQEDEAVRNRTIDFKGNIRVNNLSFVYPGAEDKTLDDISFSINEGESVAIVGESGSGKSTLFYILLGAYDNYEGDIYFEGLDLKILNKDALREQIGVVPQDALLFNGSIKENLVEDFEVADNDIYDALKKVTLLDFVYSLPMGINTVVSENGFNFSGGQRQRLALARAILNQKSMLFLDEATSALDNITEHQIVEYLSEDSKTKIVIAHRLSTIKNSDKIIVLKDGQVSEVGDHHSLMAQKGEYYRMYSGK
ncbi:peptidase domain-containing ABC transporter [Streptococcus mutans]|uniref:peptidase domain-containing ABC transporter n=1 Tax=Streptococcus mutans TaxID=1309 RepID=UPI0038B8C4AA